MMLAELRDRLVADDCNKHDQVIILITAILSEEPRNGCEIVSRLVELGYDRSHVGIQLAHHTGHDVEKHRWFKDAAARYHLLD